MTAAVLAAAGAAREAFDLVIFDCDGVLVDSERITNRVFCTMLNELGVAVTLDDMFERFVGHSMARCLELVTDMLGSAPPDDFVPELRRRAGEALATEVVPMPGIEAVLETLERPYCVASSGEPAKIALTLGTTGLLPRFQGRIFSVEDVPRAKPAPDLFLHAARTLGARPGRCAVVEDTPVGVRAGVAAGMYVLGFAAHTPPRRLADAGAHVVFSDMMDLSILLNEGPR